MGAPACATTHIEGIDLLYKMAKDEKCGAHISRCNRGKSEISPEPRRHLHL